MPRNAYWANEFKKEVSSIKVRWLHEQGDRGIAQEK